MANKMQWLIDRLNNNKGEFIIAGTTEERGTIVIPTGGGKTGVAIEDMAYRILNMKNGEKLVLNISCPILKLTKQFADDAVEVISRVFGSCCSKEEFMFLINSSADGNVYRMESLNCDCDRFTDENINRFKNSTKAKVAFVISCHKSLYKFAEKVEYINSFATIANYLDEAHLILNDTRDDKDFKHLSKDGKERWGSLETICKSKYVFAFTATPDKYVTNIINKSKGKDDCSYIIEVSAHSLIKSHTILNVHTYFKKVGNGDGEKITFNTCSDFMEFVKEDNPNIPHKILVTCSDSDSLAKLRDELSAKYKVFSTCSKEGAKFIGYDDDGNKEYADTIDIDETEFIDKIDNYNGDCFVLHIKQLRQGIDIKSLTDTIFYNSTRVNDGVKRTIIQTNGRCLRPMTGERNMADLNSMTKKYANILFLVGEKDYDAVKRQMLNILISYYGLEGLEAFDLDTNSDHGNVGKKHGNFQFGKIGDDYWDELETIMEELKINMYKYVEANIMPRYKIFTKYLNIEQNKKLIPMELATMKKEFPQYCKDLPVSDILDDSKYLEVVNDTFAKFGIKIA